MMLDIKLIRQQPDVVRDSLRVRGADVSLVDHILEVDKRRRELLQQIEALRAKQKRASAEIARRQGAEQESRIAAARDLSDRLRAQEAILREVEEELDPLLRSLPNLPTASVPVCPGT